MRISHRIGLAFGLWMAGNVLAAARLWTSQSGSQIEAELAGVQDTFAILQAEDGRQFKIPVAQLSAEDQAFIQGTLAPPAESPAPTPEPTPSAPAASAPPPPRREKAAEEALPPDSDLARLTSTNSYAVPDPQNSEAIPGIAGTNLLSIMFIGLQYGPQKTDVLYCGFESPSPQKPPAQLYLYSPGAPAYLKTVSVQGRSRRVEEERTSFFPDIKVSCSFGDIKLNADLAFSCGIGRPDTVLLLAGVELLKERAVSRFMVGGFLNEQIVMGPGPVRIVPLLQRPGISLQAFPPRINGYISMNRMSVIPKSGMDTLVTMEALDPDNDRVIDRAKVEINEEMLTKGTFNRTFFNTFSNLPRGRPYAIRATVDLGPFLGTVTRRIDFKGPKPPETGGGPAK